MHIELPLTIVETTKLGDRFESVLQRGRTRFRHDDAFTATGRSPKTNNIPVSIAVTHASLPIGQARGN